MKRPRKSLVKKPEIKLLEDKVKKLEGEAQRHQKQIEGLKADLKAKDARIQELENSADTTHKAAEVVVQTTAAAVKANGRGRAKALTEAEIAAQNTQTTTPP